MKALYAAAVAAWLCTACAQRGAQYAALAPLTPTPDADFRRQPPPALERTAGPPPSVHRAVLDNGMVVVVVERPQPALVTLRYVNRLAVDRTASEAGLAELTALALTGSGTLLENGDELRDVRINGVAPTLDVTASHSALQFRVGKDGVARTLALLARTVRNPTFGEIASVRDQVIDARGALAARIVVTGQRITTRALFGAEHVLAASPRGVAERLRAVAAGDLREYHARAYRPDASALIVVGDVTAAQVFGLAREQFGAWTATGVAPPTRPAAARPAVDTGSHVLGCSSDIAYVAFGQPAVVPGHADYWPLRVLAHALTGAFSSRTLVALRHESGLSYGVFGSIQATPDQAALLIETVVLKSDLARAVRTLRHEIRALRRSSIGESELADAKRALLREVRLDLDTNAEVAAVLTRFFVLGDPIAQRDADLARIAAVTREDVRRVARGYLKGDREVLTVIGPYLKDDRQLEGLSSVHYYAGTDLQ